MSSYDDLYGSRFLAAAELKKPVTAIITQIEQETFARDGGPTRTNSLLKNLARAKGR